jgi:hypothetical protein
MPPKTSGKGWKTGEQLELLLYQWPTFKRCQDSKTLDRFWQHVFDLWYARWPLPLPSALHTETARLMSQKAKNTVCDDR